MLASAIRTNEVIVRELFAAFNRGDIDGCAALVTDDFELVDLAQGLTLRGPEGMRQWVATFKSALPDSQTEILTLICDGEWVTSEHVGRGTNTGMLATPAGLVPPTGRSIELQIAEVYRVRDGKFDLMRAYYDLGTLLRQLGLVP